MTLDTAIRHLSQGEWQRAHELVQDDESTFGCWAHGIVHMLEGDFGNARYWYRQAQRSYPGDDASSAEIEALVRAWREQCSAKDAS